MKKLMAILLAAVVALTLLACGNTSSKTSPSASAPASSSTSAAPSPSAAVLPSASPSVSPSPTAMPSPSLSAAVSPSAKDTVGYVTDKVDHFSREPFKIAMLSLDLSSAYAQALSDSCEKWGKVLNYQYFVYNASRDYDGYVNEIATLAGMGYKGFIVGGDDQIRDRVIELCHELKVAFVGMPSALRGKDGITQWPSTMQDNYGNGQTCVQWLADNYKKYWKDRVDMSKLGMITIEFSIVDDIHIRQNGAHDTFVKLFPDAAKNIFNADLVSNTNGFSTQGANEMTAQLMAAHADITKWFVFTGVDDWAVGATRAVESLKKEACVLVVSNQADSFIGQLNAGYSGTVYAAACAIAPAEISGYACANLVTILEGRATPETIWPEWVHKGDKYPCLTVKGTMITKDTYKDWLQKSTFESLSAGMKTGK